jgi:hypothetical protein
MLKHKNAQSPIMTPSTMKYTPNKVIAVDVDGTLERKGNLNEKAIEWCRVRKAEGFFLILWSSRGAEYAKETAARLGVAEIFDVILSKPGYILDDWGWTWTRFTKVVRPF